MAVQTYAQFCQQALYGPQGYYRAPRPRVGRTAQADFYTASSVPLFARLLAAALGTLAQLNNLPNPHVAEVGNEPGTALLPTPPPGFASTSSHPLGAPASFHSPSIVFSNELLDAQPFERARFDTQKGWQLLGCDFDQKIFDLTLGPAPEALSQLLGDDWPEGATVDVSLEALALIDRLCAGGWRGVWVAFDYGLSLADLRENPRPTARAYAHHTQLSLQEAFNLPLGSVDLTHHVIWDLVASRLAQNGFRIHPVLTQEAFFVHYAAAEFPKLTPEERRQLATLLHPANMGAKFQALVATR